MYLSLSLSLSLIPFYTYLIQKLLGTLSTSLGTNCSGFRMTQSSAQSLLLLANS